VTGKSVCVLVCMLSLDTMVMLNTIKKPHTRIVEFVLVVTYIMINPYLFWPYEFLIGNISGAQVVIYCKKWIF